MIIAIGISLAYFLSALSFKPIEASKVRFRELVDGRPLTAFPKPHDKASQEYYREVDDASTALLAARKALNDEKEGIRKILDSVSDLIILMDRRTELVKLALSIGKVGRGNGTLLAKKDLPQVVTFSYFPALYTPRLRFLPWLPRKKIHEIFHYQFLLKCINSERYRACFDELDLEQARPHFNEHENAQYYLEVKRDLLALGYDLERDTRPLVVINPLSGNSDRYGYNYKHEDYVRLGHELAHAYPQLFFVITCYGNPPFSKLPLTEPNLKLWNNQGTLNHLLAMLSLSSLVIVPSTGPAHVADIMGKDVVEMMPDYDCPRWIANGMGQLASRQQQPSVGINQCRYQILRQNWKDTKASYEQHFQAFTKMCHDFIEQRTLKLFTPRNLAQ